MMNIIPQLSDFLKYGLIGLVAIMAILAFFLLRREQNKVPKRSSTIYGIYAFMVFSIVIIILGMFAPSYNNTKSEQEQTINADRAKRPKVKVKQKNGEDVNQRSEINIEDSQGSDIEVEQDGSVDTLKSF